MQRGALAERGGRRLAAGAPHAGQPPMADQRGLGRIGHIDDGQNMVDEALEMHRGIGVTAADPPDAMRAEARHGEIGDFARRGRIGNIEDAHAGAERLVDGQRVGQRLGVIVGLAGILLHRPDIRAVDGHQQVAVNLQMVRAGIFRSGDEGDRFRLARVAHIDNGKTVGEHMADKSVALVDNYLHAVEPAALIAARQQADVLGTGASDIGHLRDFPVIRIAKARLGDAPNRALLVMAATMRSWRPACLSCS